MATPRVFTIEEATALVPELKRLVGRQMLRQEEIEQRASKLVARTGESPPDLEPGDDDAPDVRALKADLLERIAAYREGWHEVAATGAVIKDTRAGLIDFYGQLDGRMVWLCWKLGEDAIEWFHELDSGFSARKRLDPAIRRTLLN